MPSGVQAFRDWRDRCTQTVLAHLWSLCSCRLALRSMAAQTSDVALASFLSSKGWPGSQQELHDTVSWLHSVVLRVVNSDCAVHSKRSFPA
jgi:hypothetical protein